MKRNSLKAAMLCGFVGVQLFAFGQQTQLYKPLANPAPNIIHKSYPNEQGLIRCHTMEMDSIRRANNPGMPTLHDEEMWLQQKIKEFKAKQANGEAKMVVITIPVVVHVIHNGDAVGTGENISDCQVESQIQVMNEDFRRMMGTNGYNTHPDGADVEVEFCLATVDPNGSPTNGIDRVNYGVASFTSTGAVDNMKTNTIWNPDDYMNMWCVRFGGGASGLLGYAQFPNNSGLGGLSTNNGSANTDGVVAGYQYFGSSQICPSGTYSAPYDLGRTMTHEVGHYLGLRHIWGDSNCGNDFCADTPESQTSNYNCPSGQTTCDGIQDMVENYMDYTNDACMNIFTQDQKTRILTVLSVSPRRSTLGSSAACQSPTSDDASISNILDPNGIVCASNITPVVTLTNAGNNTLNSVDILYNIDGGANSTFNWTGTLAPGASVDVTLPTLSPSAGAHTFNASTNNPNGTTDGNTGNDAALSSFTLVIGGEAVTLTIDTDCYGEEVQWALFDQGTTNVVAEGGNLTYTPNGTQQGTDPTDPGAYGSSTTITESLCLTGGQCYDFEIYDSYGDGMYGSQYSTCSVDGDWQITDASATVLASMQAANSDYGFEENASFCLAAPCAATFDTPQTATENCFGDNTNAITVNFTAGNSTGATYDIGSGPQGSNVFSNLAQGNYTITVVDGDACTSSLSVTVSGPSQLNVNAVSNDISCNGQDDGQITVNVTGGTTNYTYDIGGASQPGNTFTNLNQANYTVTVVDANGCSETDAVTINEPAVLTASTGTITPEYFGNDGSVDLNVSGGSAPYFYTWTDGGSYSSGMQDPSNMPGGNYSVTITDANGCMTTVTDIIVPSELGIDENGNTVFSIYPNPSNGVFNVQLVDPSSVMNVTVMDIAGRVVYANDNVDNTFVVDLSSAASGTYMINIETNAASFMKRIVLKK
jgi:hypothetical protein